MKETYTLSVIARVRNDFPERSGLPRQSGLTDSVRSKIIFEPEYRNPDSFKGLERCPYIWVIWGFSMTAGESWSPTVRPRHLGGREIGVFASRSPFRPNPLALSCVRLESIEDTEGYGAVLNIAGADMADMSPVFDIKPYIPRTESHPETQDGRLRDFGARPRTGN